MRYSSSLVCRAGILLGVTVAAVVTALQPARAQNIATNVVAGASEEKWVVKTSPGKNHPGRPYFIEFRARAAANYGHMYVLYGRVNGARRNHLEQIAGLHPAGDANDCFNCSLFNWTVGHLVPVPSETGASDGDLEEKYVTARYRVWLTAAEFKKVDAYVRKLQADNPTWNALFNNCVGFGRNIAEFMGLKVPAFVWLEPKDFVEGMREENGLKAEQLPLKDAAVSSSPHVAASHAAPLPPQKPAMQPVSQSQPAATKPAPAAKPKKPVASKFGTRAFNVCDDLQARTEDDGNRRAIRFSFVPDATAGHRPAVCYLSVRRCAGFLAASRAPRRPRSTTMRSCVPEPISSISSRALTLNSMRRPSTLVTSASAVT